MNPDSQQPGQTPPASRPPNPPARKLPPSQDDGQPAEQAGATDAPLPRVPSEGDKPVGTSDNDGSSPYEEPHHRAKEQRDR